MTGGQNHAVSGFDTPPSNVAGKATILVDGCGDGCLAGRRKKAQSREGGNTEFFIDQPALAMREKSRKNPEQGDCRK